MGLNVIRLSSMNALLKKIIPSVASNLSYVIFAAIIRNSESSYGRQKGSVMIKQNPYQIPRRYNQNPLQTQTKIQGCYFYENKTESGSYLFTILLYILAYLIDYANVFPLTNCYVIQSSFIPKQSIESLQCLFSRFPQFLYMLNLFGECCVIDIWKKKILAQVILT